MPYLQPLLKDKRVFHTVFAAFGFEALRCLEQKEIVGMKDNICKITLPVRLVVDGSAGTFLVSKTRTLFPRHRRIVAFDPDLQCVASNLS